MLLTPTEMQAAEDAAFAGGAEAEPLMDRAGLGMARAIRQFFPQPGTAVLFLGSGHNAGDALVAAAHLADWGWDLAFVKADPAREFRPLTQKKFAAAAAANLRPWDGGVARRPLVCLDGLLGIGAKGALRGGYLEAAREMNRLRREAGAITFALDIPSGLDGETGAPGAGAVEADVTLTVAQVKAGLAADAAIDHVGRLALIPLDELVPLSGQGDASRAVFFPSQNRGLLPRRAFDTHKGMAGRVAIVAGSRGLAGAAALCSAAALRAGAGLVTVFAAEDAYPIIAALCRPEVMVRPCRDYGAIDFSGFGAAAIGPGLGMAHAAEIRAAIASAPCPLVADADALNALADDLAALDSPGSARLLTPHPGEMQRLLGGAPVGDRAETARAFAEAHPGVTLLLKGSRTAVAEAGRPVSLNPTGHPGMASGGMGDALTGIAAALLAQGLGAYAAARLGSWLLGRAAEIAIFENGQSTESLAAGDVIEALGPAFAGLPEDF